MSIQLNIHTWAISPIRYTAASTINHQQILRPVLTGGLIVDLLLVDAAGRIQEHRIMPVDATLADAPEITARFQDPLTVRLDLAAQPSAACSASGAKYPRR